jgi:hypothetical protein
MADRIMFISWGENVAGREERGLEVFNEAVGMYGRLQQEGKVESFDVALLNPTGGQIDGFMTIGGTAEQLAAVRESEEYLRNMADASLIVKNLCVCEGFVNEGVAKMMGIYQDAISRVPQMA